MRSNFKYTQEATNDVAGYRQASKPLRIVNTVIPLYLGGSFSVYEQIIQSATLPVTQNTCKEELFPHKFPDFEMSLVNTAVNFFVVLQSHSHGSTNGFCF